MTEFNGTRYSFTYSEYKIDYQIFRLHRGSETYGMRLEKVNTSVQMSDFKDEILKPRIIQIPGTPDEILYLTCYDPYELSEELFWRWLYEQSSRYLSQYSRLLELTSNKVKSLDGNMSDTILALAKRNAFYDKIYNLFSDVQSYSYKHWRIATED